MIRKLGVLFVDLCRNPDFIRAYPVLRERAGGLESSLEACEPDELEARVTQFYCILHSADTAYAEEELSRLHGLGGYWCYAGGLDPLIRAEPYIKEASCSVDLGAGNGLQGLLLQYLFPHQMTTQVELSRRMIERGRRLSTWMGLSEERFNWVHDDIANVSLDDFDLIYMYLPVRPEGIGKAFYRLLGERLGRIRHPVVIFSVADCFRPYAPGHFRVFYSDGHLTCYAN